MSDHGQHVSDWALVRFGRKFSHNRFRDGSWAAQSMTSNKMPEFLQSAGGILLWIVLFGMLSAAPFLLSIH